MGRKAIPQVLPPIVSGKNTAKLDSQKAVRLEMAKLYRMVMSGKLPSDVAARLVYILKEVRSAIEAEPPVEVTAGNSGPLIILSVPPGSVVDPETGLITTPTGAPVTCEPLKPFEGTPAFERLTDQMGPIDPLPVVQRIDDDKIAVLHPHWPRDDDAPGVA
jgi:hypothetical protein